MDPVVNTCVRCIVFNTPPEMFIEDMHKLAEWYTLALCLGTIRPVSLTTYKNDPLVLSLTNTPTQPRSFDSASRSSPCAWSLFENASSSS